MSPKDFPLSHLIPKDITQCERYLAKHPEYDGRGVVVAIFDSGIDPGALYLQKTTDGKPKIIDVIDASGAGDIDIKTVRKVGDDGRLQLFSGRMVEVPSTWQNPSGEYHLGMKRVHELFPDVLKNRVKDDAKKEWEKNHRQCTAAAAQALADFDAKNPNKAGLDAQAKKTRQDLEDRLEQLASINKAYDEPGPYVDAVVFHNGTHWKACLVSPRQDLAEAKVMGEYRFNQEYAAFSEGDMMNYSFNVYAGGNVLSVPICCSPHGTHVAGIVAAHNPDNPAMNGVAPGAQIVSINIGDYRLGSMETGNSLVRALGAAIQYKADLINMSYGEDVQVPEVGHFMELAKEVVHKHGIIYVSSAGNDGPALSTATAPAGANNAIISVGAMVTTPMMDVEYSIRENLPPTTYTWSSRGPSYNGAHGVSICAPGGAITSVPNFTLKGGQLMNGTSMASPNACGGFALILSGLKQAGIPYTPQRVRKGVENSAWKSPDMDVFGRGHGILQVDSAFEHIAANKDYLPFDVRCEVAVPALGPQAKGIYLRERDQTVRPKEITVHVTPKFPEKAPVFDKIKFQGNVRLVCDAKWVDVPSNFVLLNEERAFAVKVDPTHKSLLPGPHFTEILGFDVENMDAGPLFNVPVTVIKTEPSQDTPSDSSPVCAGVSFQFTDIPFKPAAIVRKFFDAPPAATWVDLKLTGHNIDCGERKIVIHAQQLLPQRGHQRTEFHNTVALTEGVPAVRSFAVSGGSVVEVCLSQFWSSLGTCNVTAEVEFHGVIPNQHHVYFSGVTGIARVDIATQLRPEVLLPAATIKSSRQSVRPTNYTITPALVNPYDVLPDNRQVYTLLLEYNFTQTESCEVTPRFPLVNDRLYESEYQSQMYQLCDKNKRPLLWGEAFAKKAKLDKGDYIVRLMVNSDRMDALERLKDMLLVIDRALPAEIKLEGYSSYNNALMGKDKFRQKVQRRGEKSAVFFTAPPADKIPSYLKAGDMLIGRVTYGKTLESHQGAGKKPKGFPFTYIVPAPAVPPQKAPEAVNGETDDVSEWDKMLAAVRDQKMAWLAKLYKDEKTKEQADTLFAELAAAYPTHLPLFAAKLKAVDGNGDTKTMPLKQKDCRPAASLTAVIEAADTVINMVDQSAVAAHFGLNADSENPLFAKKRAEMSKQKETLIDALQRKGRVQTELALGQDNADWSSVTATIQQLSQWVDAADTSLLLVRLHAERGAGRLGSALKVAAKLLEGGAGNGDFKRKLTEYRTELLGTLGWDHAADHEARWMHFRYPQAYPLL
eukprot:comp24032_c0_seq1/m.43017 comp24032_c0_seq1/g.43017  ORF comp24032_c0_seq1/g.43017 comp24032_c0_seq1/m.43017 type:complete len:1277 (-) comp24032_c0_seq1:73-3903(-)